jgi:hypothetical protein
MLCLPRRYEEDTNNKFFFFLVYLMLVFIIPAGIVLYRYVRCGEQTTAQVSANMLPQFASSHKDGVGQTLSNHDAIPFLFFFFSSTDHCSLPYSATECTGIFDSSIKRADCGSWLISFYISSCLSSVCGCPLPCCCGGSISSALKVRIKCGIVRIK